MKWTAPEYEHRRKDVSWYWISIGVAVVILAAAIWQKNFLFAVFVILAEILIIVWADREPRTIEFKVSHHGLLIDERKLYPFSHIDSFSFSHQDHTDYAEIIFHLHQRIQPRLRVHIPKERTVELQNTLTPIVPMVDHEEHLIDLIEKYIWF